MKKSLLLLLALTPSISSAFFCPSNFNQIDFGATIDQINQQCGKPDTENKYKKQIDNMPQEWTYYIPQTVAFNTLQQANGTMKTSFAFDSSGKLINMTVNGIGVGASTICGGNTLSLGASRQDVENSCGKPSFINKQNAPGTTGVGQGSSQSIDVVEYKYNSTPPVTLVFENGVLKSRK